MLYRIYIEAFSGSMIIYIMENIHVIFNRDYGCLIISQAFYKNFAYIKILDIIAISPRTKRSLI